MMEQVSTSCPAGFFQVSQSPAKAKSESWAHGETERRSDLAIPHPFVEPVRWNQTSTLLQRIAEGGLGGHRLRTGVDHLIADARILAQSGIAPPSASESRTAWVPRCARG